MVAILHGICYNVKNKGGAMKTLHTTYRSKITGDIFYSHPDKTLKTRIIDEIEFLPVTKQKPDNHFQPAVYLAKHSLEKVS